MKDNFESLKNLDASEIEELQRIIEALKSGDLIEDCYNEDEDFEENTEDLENLYEIDSEDSSLEENTNEKKLEDLDLEDLNLEDLYNSDLESFDSFDELSGFSNVNRFNSFDKDYIIDIIKNIAKSNSKILEVIENLMARDSSM